MEYKETHDILPGVGNRSKTSSVRSSQHTVTESHKASVQSTDSPDSVEEEEEEDQEATGKGFEIADNQIIKFAPYIGRFLKDEGEYIGISYETGRRLHYNIHNPSVMSVVAGFHREEAKFTIQERIPDVTASPWVILSNLQEWYHRCLDKVIQEKNLSSVVFASPLRGSEIRKAFSEGEDGYVPWKIGPDGTVYGKQLDTRGHSSKMRGAYLHFGTREEMWTWKLTRLPPLSEDELLKVEMERYVRKTYNIPP